MDTKMVVTHDGVFHADEVFACAVLSTVYEAYEVPGMTIVRTRDPAVLAAADIVVDVGGRYDGVKWFDHHQPGGAGERAGIPYSSAGLVWKHFGETALRVLGVESTAYVQQLVDERLIRALDAHDNGVKIWTTVGAYPAPLTLSGVISSFNNAPDGFATAVLLASEILRNTVAAIAKELRSEEHVRRAVADCTGPVLVLDQPGPWKRLVIGSPTIVYVVFKDDKTGDWRLQGVPTALGSFEVVLPLPAEWAGASDLAAITGVADATFCHAQRWIAGALSREGAIALAAKALE